MTPPAYDGKQYPYIPSAELPEATASILDESHSAVDPTTFEVLRHALWNLNLEHGSTIQRTSGSPVVAYAHDFNPVILDQRGDYIFFGPWLQYLISATSFAVKWIMENRHPQPGIEPGSMFLTNDPWVGATHQSDVSVLAPVFWEGKLFCWVGNSLHHNDLGGTAPGGFNPIAEDVFHESGVIPPVRMVEDGRIRADFEDEFARRSRIPEVAVVDLRAQVAGCRTAIAGLEKLLGRYGPEVLKGAMRKIQDDSEATFVERISTIPDGEWREEAFLEMATAGDRKLHRNSMVLRKSGDRLVFSNEGTDPQIGTINCTHAAWFGSILAMINPQLMHDQLFAPGGAIRHISFEPEPGSITSALYPSPVSLAVLTLDQCIALAASCISKMLACSTDPGLREDVYSSLGAATYPVSAFSGVVDGKPFASLFMDVMGAAMPALSWRDGIDAGGYPWDPLGAIPNVEENETFYPLLYLWRRVLPDAGGAGRYRGGNSLELAVVPHGVETVDHHMASAAHNAVPFPPLHGGYPSSLHRWGLARETGVRDELATGRLRSAEEISYDEIEPIPAKAFGIPQGPDDVFVFSWCGAGGYGDPLDREPQRVREDVALGVVSASEATRLYGVVLVDGELDAEATASRRGELRKERRGWEGPGTTREVAAEARSRGPAGPELELLDEGEETVIACSTCRTALAPGDGNWKRGATRNRIPLEAGNRHQIELATVSDDAVEIVQLACPGCGRLLQNEICRAGEEPAWDLRLTLAAESDRA